MRILFINSDPDRSELDLVLKINAKGIFIKILASEYSKYRKELEEAGVISLVKIIIQNGIGH